MCLSRIVIKLSEDCKIIFRMPEVSKINFKLSEAYKNFENILENF